MGTSARTHVRNCQSQNNLVKMSFSGIRSALSGAGRLLSNGRSVNFNTKATRSLFQGRTVVSLPNRCFTRSLWYMCQPKHQSVAKPVNGFPKMCGCCGLHTQGDKEMMDFLADEIKMEVEGDKSKGKLPQINGFELIKHDAADVVMRRSANGETVTIRFSVNHSIDDDAGMDFEDGKEPETEMVSRPSFTVEINKGSNKTLAVQCQFPAPDAMPPTQGENEDEFVDMIEISELTILNNNEGDWPESSYVLSGSVMDGNLYDMVLNMLEERGLTADCIDQLVEFATQYEHKQYVELLKAVQSFVQEK